MQYYLIIHASFLPSWLMFVGLYSNLQTEIIDNLANFIRNYIGIKTCLTNDILDCLFLIPLRTVFGERLVTFDDNTEWLVVWFHVSVTFVFCFNLALISNFVYSSSYSYVCGMCTDVPLTCSFSFLAYVILRYGRGRGVITSLRQILNYDKSHWELCN